MMKTSMFKLVKLKTSLSLASGLFLMALGGPGHGLDLPADAQGTCPAGYANVITTPVIPFTSNSDMKTYRLPPGVCLKRYQSIDRTSQDTNFTVNSILPLSDAGVPVFRSVDGSKFVAQDYEAVVGHFATDAVSWANAINPQHAQFGNFKGVHPFLVAKSAHASIRFENGHYLIDKQLRYGDSSSSTCQSGYSTVGTTKTCYFKKNRIVKNAVGKAELRAAVSVTPELDTIGQECPLGMSTASNLGSHGGICTDNQLLFNMQALKNSNISVLQGTFCQPEEVLNGTVCIPIFTARYCRLNGGELMVSVSSRMSNKHFDFPNKSAFGSLTTQHLGAFQMAHLDTANSNRFETDYLLQTFTNPLQRIPVLHVFTNRICDELDLDTDSFSVEPSPPAW